MIAGAPSRMVRDSTETATALATKSSSLRMEVPARTARQMELGSRANLDEERLVAMICKARTP